MRGVIDRIEGAFAVLEIEGITLDFPVSLLPGAREGAILNLTIELEDPPEPSTEDSGGHDDPMDIQL